MSVTPPLQAASTQVYHLLAGRYPKDFPPSLFIHMGLSMLQPSTQACEQARTNAIHEVLAHLVGCHKRAPVDHADVIKISVLTLKNTGVPCVQSLCLLVNSPGLARPAVRTVIRLVTHTAMSPPDCSH